MIKANPNPNPQGLNPNKMTNGSDTSRMNVLIPLPGKEPEPAEVHPEGKDATTTWWVTEMRITMDCHFHCYLFLFLMNVYGNTYIHFCCPHNKYVLVFIFSPSVHDTTHEKRYLKPK